MQRYVLGFAFSQGGTIVTLIKKKRGPVDLIGLWNGLGGKIEGAETPREAMQREFFEECGVDIDEAFWKFEGTMHNIPCDWQVEVFSCTLKPGEVPQTNEDEEVAQWPVDTLPKVVPNLHWMIPACHNGEQYRWEAYWS